MSRNQILMVIAIAVVGCTKQSELNTELIKGTWRSETSSTVNAYTIKGDFESTYSADGQYSSEGKVDVFVGESLTKIADLKVLGTGKWLVKDASLVIIPDKMDIVEFQSDDNAFTKEALDKTTQEMIGVPIYSVATTVLNDHVELKDHKHAITTVMKRTGKKK